MTIQGRIITNPYLLKVCKSVPLFFLTQLSRKLCRRLFPSGAPHWHTARSGVRRLVWSVPETDPPSQRWVLQLCSSHSRFLWNAHNPPGGRGSLPVMSTFHPQFLTRWFGTCWEWKERESEFFVFFVVSMSHMRLPMLIWFMVIFAVAAAVAAVYTRAICPGFVTFVSGFMKAFTLALMNP